MNSWGSLLISLGLHVHCLQVLFPLGTVLRTPTWRFPVSSQVASVVTADLGASESGGAEVSSREVHLVSSSGPCR